ncbi:hypothetical protein BHE74_00022862 [Ensete ventricosum]|nr:hypothetical protein BHE74_00022862 [Ensete ventricosum]RZS22472.1 hypothetical protein BHM03_00055261 [Ensete ventricosum]
MLLCGSILEVLYTSKPAPVLTLKVVSLKAQTLKVVSLKAHLRSTIADIVIVCACTSAAIHGTRGTKSQVEHVTSTSSYSRGGAVSPGLVVEEINGEESFAPQGGTGNKVIHVDLLRETYCTW